MKDISIGIIGSETERHCLYLSQELKRQGARPFIMDNMPNRSFPLSMEEEKSEYEGMDLSQANVYFLRALFLPTPAFDSSEAAADGYASYAAERERYAAWLSWLMAAPYQNRLIVNPVDTLMIHFAKPFHIERLRATGIPVPQTLVTGKPEKLLEFSRHREVIYKPVAGGALCRLLTEEDKQPERLEALASAPVQFQECIHGQDLRVFVLGGKVIASFLIEGDEIDYREGTKSVRPYEVTPEIAALSIKACKTLGLIFSGIDFKLRPDGSVVCIECNPSPMFEGFDRVAPISIVSQLASYLIKQSVVMRSNSISLHRSS